MKSAKPFREPEYAFIFRKYPEYLAAIVAIIALLLADVDFFLGGTPGNHSGSPYFINAAALLAVAALALIGHRRAPLCRFAATDSVVTLPFSRARGIRIPEKLPMDNLRGVSLEPAERRPDLPALVQLTLAGLEGGESELTVEISGRDFGVRNLRELVLRIHPDRIGSRFGREWQKWVLNRAFPGSDMEPRT